MRAALIMTHRELLERQDFQASFRQLIRGTRSCRTRTDYDYIIFLIQNSPLFDARVLKDLSNPLRAGGRRPRAAGGGFAQVSATAEDHPS